MKIFCLLPVLLKTLLWTLNLLNSQNPFISLEKISEKYNVLIIMIVVTMIWFMLSKASWKKRQFYK